MNGAWLTSYTAFWILYTIPSVYIAGRYCFSNKVQCDFLSGVTSLLLMPVPRKSRGDIAPIKWKGSIPHAILISIAEPTFMRAQKLCLI